tara:strand:- start:963 stop:1214 length:252 start_codon:yes stop_codon:yes gene_type:complete
MPLVNQKAEYIVRGMKKRSSDFKRLYGTRDKEVMYATANKLAQKEMVKPPLTYKQFIENYGTARKSKGKGSKTCQDPSPTSSS